jgi:Uma2 family endonuclease
MTPRPRARRIVTDAALLHRLTPRLDTMAMPDTAQRWTAQMVRELPDDGKRREVIHGELLVSPSPRPRHELVRIRLIMQIEPYLRASGVPETLFGAPCDISWDADTLVQPDLLVVPPGEVTNDWATYRTLRLAVEILSPSTARDDRVTKRRLYQEYDVATYWIVDHRAGVVEVWHPLDQRPDVVSDVLRWRVTSEAPELAVDLEALFRGLPE